MKPVLAIYDVRGKQEFIFRTNKLKEIVGGSWLIRDCFADYLFPAAREIGEGTGKGLYYYKDETGKARPGSAFSRANFERHMEEGYLGEVLYDGGGNFELLYRDEETFREVTYRFTAALMREIGTLHVQGTCVPADHFEEDNYTEDIRRLFAKHRENRHLESVISPWSCLPIVQVDRATSQPLVVLPEEQWCRLQSREKQEKHSKESWMKLLKYRREMDRLRRQPDRFSKAEGLIRRNVDEFDKMVTKKGEDSQLAVIYIDGNSLGAKVKECLGSSTGYEECIQRLRTFSGEIQSIYVEKGIEAVMGGGEKAQKHRIVVYAGDEVNFIVPARDAYACALRYLKALPEGHSACAGIAVFHSHSPYAEAYRIAEECCESGKRTMKQRGLKEACLLDYHICQGATGVSLEQIREKENGVVISRPWLYSVDASEEVFAGDLTGIRDVEHLASLFNRLGRGNVKNLAELAKRSQAELNLDLWRIRAHQSEAERAGMKPDWDWLDQMEESRKRSLIYDVVRSYDLWFQRDRASGE